MILFFYDKIFKINLFALYWGHFCQWHINTSTQYKAYKDEMLVPSLNNIFPFELCL